MKGHRLNVALNKKQIDFIEKIRNEVKDSKGRKLSKDKTIGAILKACMKKNFKIGKVKNEKELEKELLRAN